MERGNWGRLAGVLLGQLVEGDTVTELHISSPRFGLEVEDAFFSGCGESRYMWDLGVEVPGRTVGMWLLCYWQHHLRAYHASSSWSHWLRHSSWDLAEAWKRSKGTHIQIFTFFRWFMFRIKLNILNILLEIVQKTSRHCPCLRRCLYFLVEKNGPGRLRPGQMIMEQTQTKGRVRLRF